MTQIKKDFRDMISVMWKLPIRWKALTVAKLAFAAYGAHLLIGHFLIQISQFWTFVNLGECEVILKMWGAA